MHFYYGFLIFFSHNTHCRTKSFHIKERNIRKILHKWNCLFNIKPRWRFSLILKQMLAHLSKPLETSCSVCQRTIFDFPWKRKTWSTCVYTVMSTTQIREMKFGIANLDSYHTEVSFETFYEDQSHSMCTGLHKRGQIFYSLSEKFIIATF